jgi:signal transduction histidine kinase
MRRRLTATIVAVVAAALVVAGFGTLALIRQAARDEARRDLARQVESIAAQAEVRDLQVFRRALRLEGAVVVGIGPGGGVLGGLPDGVTPRDLDQAELRAGRTLSGVRGRLAWAAAPIPRPRGLSAVVLTNRVATGTGRAAAYLLLTGTGALAAAAAAAAALARRITRPLADAEAATRRIAAGDLSVQVPVEDSEPELASLARSINAMAAALDRSRRAERQFLMSVSHDLRTPLTSIRGFAEAITDGAARDTKRAARVITAESRRLERLVGDLLDLARLDARRFTLDTREVDVADVVVDTAEGFRQTIEAEGLILRLDASSPLPLRADPERLAQVVANLVENALTYARSTIDVRVAPSGPDHVEIAVVDDGPGIPADELPRIFERLYRSDRTTGGRRVGTGLGLAIVAELVELMEGEVAARSEADGGTRLTVLLRRDGSSSDA